jgi:flagellar hook-associated protein 1 FlgK
MFVQREELSGVSEDEETSKMITYQRAFQAAAKFISIVDVLYETLINM